MEEISKLSEKELRDELISRGVEVGPITPITRRLFERKLHKLISPVVEDNSDEKTTQDPSSYQDPFQPISSPSVPQPIDKTIYYVVQLPEDKVTDIQSTPGRMQQVFTNKKDVLQMMKTKPGSRFKTFSTYAEAESFEWPKDPHPQLPMSPKVPAESAPPPDASLFRGPKMPELNRFRRGIERNDFNLVKEKVWLNPRFLISAGDTPVILQEGFRYNAFHVCASKGRSDLCRYILSVLQDVNLFKLLYPADTPEIRNERIRHIIDLYLNTPDKGNGETPLHFACKFGHKDMVEFLTEQPGTDRTRVNKHGETPAMVVGTRMNSPDKNIENSIKELLEANCFVPLLRAVDYSTPPVVGTPWSPDDAPSAMSSSSTTQGFASPIAMGSPGPREAMISVMAYAGPMSPSQATRFRKNWLTPPSPSPKDVKWYRETTCGDSEKGLERIGRQVAEKLKIRWTEYWDFLGCYTDFHSNSGLEKLESYLAERVEEMEKLAKMNHDLDQLGKKLAAFHLVSPDPGQSSPSSAPLSRSSPGNGGVTPTSSPGSRQHARSPMFDMARRMAQALGVPDARDISPQHSPVRIILQQSKFNLSPRKLFNSLTAGNDNDSDDENTVLDVRLINPMFKVFAETNSPTQKVNQPSLSGTCSPSHEDGPTRSCSGQTNQQRNEGTSSSSKSGSSPMTDSNANDTKDTTEESSKANLKSTPEKDCQDPLVDRCSPILGALSPESEPSPSSYVRQVSNTSDVSYHTALSIDDDDSRTQDFEDADEDMQNYFCKESVFILGPAPCKVDLDVLRALDHVTIDKDLFPHITQWQKQVTSYSALAKKNWKTPRIKRSSMLTPQSGPNEVLNQNDDDVANTSSSDINKTDPVKQNLFDSFESP